MIKEDFIKELSNLLVGAKCEHNIKGEGKVNTINNRIAQSQFGDRDIIIEISFADKVAMFYLFAGFKKKSLSFNDVINAKLSALIPTFEQVIADITKEEKEKERAEEKAYQDARKKAIEEEKARKAVIARQLKIETALKNAKNMGNHSIVLTNDFYTILGFIAKHAGAFTANVPDFLEDWFRATFPGQAYTFCDSTKKTSGGYSMKWGLALMATLKDIDEDSMPAAVSNCANIYGNKITDTQFVYDLVDRFGFRFGKKQDIEKILETIPADKLDKFNAGFNA